MRILMIAPQPFFSPRGTPLSVYYRAKVLSDMGHKIDLLTYPIGQDVELENMRCIRSPGLPFVYDIKIGPSFKKILLDIPLFIQAVYMALKNRYDILYAHEEAVFLCCFLNAVFKIKYVYDMHSSLPQQLENFNFTRMKLIKWFFTLLEKHSLARASAVITICKELEDLVGEYGYSKKNELIQNTLFDPVKLDSGIGHVYLSEIIDMSNRYIVLYAGTFESYQGIDMYLESIRHILSRRNDMLFIFLGGSPAQVFEMRERAEQLKITESTVFTGRVEVNLAKEFIKKADVLVSPRLKGTNTPLKIYEYMASKVPIVATNLRTHTQEIDGSSAFLCDPEPVDFARGIMECINNREEARQKAENAFALYHMRYGEDVYKDKINRILERVQ